MNINIGKVGREMGGRPKGSKNKRTIAKENALKRYEDDILNNLKGITLAQLSIALGVNVMMAKERVKNKKGKWVYDGELRRIVDPEQMLQILNDSKLEENKEYFWITSKDPNPKAIEDVMNRLFGKPKEKLEVGVTKNLAELVQGLIKK